ncbi:hypothetical protein OXX80_006302 [Metschnikowia pulcherrima]|nr:hypothetical protein OY671_003671 [Metschnikowia pulcherrima]
MYPYRPVSVPPTRRRRRPRLFTKDIETLLYSMGDGPVSLDSTVNCLEDCLVEFLTDLSHESLRFARSHGRSRIKVDDVPFALRNDPQKLGRMSYIREQLHRIEKAKKMYDTNNVNEKELFADDDEEDPDEGGRPSKKAKKKERGKKKKAEQAENSESE